MSESLTLTFCDRIDALAADPHFRYPGDGAALPILSAHIERQVRGVCAAIELSGGYEVSVAQIKAKCATASAPGSFWAAVLAFLQSPAGQALISALVTMIINLINNPPAPAT